MLDNIKIQNILFLDIETVPAFSSYSELPEPIKLLWDKKAGFLQKENETPEILYKRAGIYAEFGKIICISVGFITDNVITPKDKATDISNNGQPVKSMDEFRTKSFFGDAEKELLTQFVQLLNHHYNKPHHLLCAHNGKEFDFPYLARRMLINGIKLPKILDIAGKKPWEIAHLDTMELWKFGDYKHYTSLHLLSEIFDIPTPKNDIDGSDVARVYWEESNLDRIVLYCQKDVIAVAQLFHRFIGEPLINEKSIISITESTPKS